MWTPHHSVFFTGRMPFLPPNQQRQCTEYAGLHTWWLASNMHISVIFVNTRCLVVVLPKTVAMLQKVMAGSPDTKPAAAAEQQVANHLAADLSLHQAAVAPNMPTTAVYEDKDWFQVRHQKINNRTLWLVLILTCLETNELLHKTYGNESYVPGYALTIDFRNVLSTWAATSYGCWTVIWQIRNSVFTFYQLSWREMNLNCSFSLAIVSLCTLSTDSQASRYRVRHAWHNGA